MIMTQGKKPTKYLTKNYMKTKTIALIHRVIELSCK